MRSSMLTERISRGRRAGRTATLRGVLVAVGFALGTGAVAALAAEPTAPAAPSAPQAAAAPAASANTTPSGSAGLSQKAETPEHAAPSTQADTNTTTAADTPPFDP